jgi:Mn2+/Fe2+ NRAMP family transporter
MCTARESRRIRGPAKKSRFLSSTSFQDGKILPRAVVQLASNPTALVVGSCAYAVAEGAAWHGSMADKPKRARKFYAVMAFAMVLGLVLNYLGLNAVKMVFWSAVINGLLAPPQILLVILLTSSHKVMGKQVNPPLLRYFGWATFAVMTAAAVGMFTTS